MNKMVGSLVFLVALLTENDRLRLVAD